MISSYIAHLLMFTLLSVGMHEFYHLAVLKLLGGEGYIRLTLWGGYVTPELAPAWGMWIVLLSGGSLTALTLAILGLWFEDEVEERAAVLPHITTQLGYGVCEALLWPRLPRRHFIILMNIIAFSCFLLGGIIGILNLLRGMEKRGGKVQREG